MTQPAIDVMQEATFVLPVRVESRDRLNNLLTVLRFLRRTYPSRIIVGTDGDPAIRPMLPPGVEFVELHGPAHLPFHPARAVNDLARLITTPVVVRTEADVIIPPTQMRQAVQMTVSSEFDLVRPYTAAFTVNQHERVQFADGEEYDEYATEERRLPFKPLGYCAVWNFEAYCRGGMENEHFVAWGLDDNERLARADLLGMRHTQVDGAIFHLNHSRGSDSLDTTPFYKGNEREYHRIRHLAAGELTAEVQSWPWLQGSTSRPIEPVPADDLTIVTVVHDTSEEQLRQAAAAVRAARAATTARIVFVVPRPRRAAMHLPDGIHVVRTPEGSRRADRAKLINAQLKRAETPLAAVLDPGVVIPPQQWNAALAALHSGASLVVPYDRAARVPYSSHPWLERADFASMPPSQRGDDGGSAEADCVLLHRASHRAAGFDNERITSPAIRGQERAARFRTLGLKVQQIPGEVYHLDRPVGPDTREVGGTARGDGAASAAPDRAEFERIAAMSEKVLRAEIATWPWADDHAGLTGTHSPARRPDTSIDLAVMRHATFTIPVRIDSADRLSNLISVVKHLHRNYPSKIIVGSEAPELLRSALPPEVELLSVHAGGDLPFHHTRVLNDLARLVETPVLVNIETDIIIPRDQLVTAVQLALDGSADLVLPYDFAVDVRREERVAFAEADVTAPLADGRSRYGWPVIGGCIVWNRASFVRVGMENEHFISWGLEDDERLVRAERLGGVVCRIGGPLFHLQHHRGPDSSQDTPYYPNNRIELSRIRKMPRERLEREVKRWPWIAGTTSIPVERVEADDLTVTIPVRLDTTDRLHNLIASTKVLVATTTARVIVGIGDPDSVREYLPAEVEVVAVDDSAPSFHRTRILNTLARLASTEYLANHDTDVIARVTQWQETLSLLRAGADLVLPYDDGLVDYPYGHHPWMQRAAYSSMPPFSFGSLNPWSVGGCVVWRRSSFLAAGMENERFVSWGAEDDERIHRARTLGLRVERATGSLMHLRHRRGPDSSRQNPHFSANEAELARVMAMSAEELAAEVATWPWCSHGYR